MYLPEAIAILDGLKGDESIDIPRDYLITCRNLFTILSSVRTSLISLGLVLPDHVAMVGTSNVDLTL